MSILVVGSVAFDTIKTPFGKKDNILGGSASYFSASARFFNPVSLVAVVGRDFPPRYIKFFKDRGIDTAGLEIKEGKTFRWEGEYGWDFGDPKTLATSLNVFADFDPKIPREYRNEKYVFLANIDPALQRKVLSQIAKPKVVGCDTMNYWIEHKRSDLVKLLKSVDIFLLNESEAKEFTKETSLFKAAKQILKLGPKWVIIKKGEHGSLLFSNNSVFSTTAYFMESILDPTGAGDTFAGGMMGYLAACGRLNQASMRSAIVYGGVMATFAVEDFSLRRLGSITKKDITKRFNEFKRLTRF